MKASGVSGNGEGQARSRLSGLSEQGLEHTVLPDVSLPER